MDLLIPLEVVAVTVIGKLPAGAAAVVLKVSCEEQFGLHVV